MMVDNLVLFSHSYCSNAPGNFESTLRCERSQTTASVADCTDNSLASDSVSDWDSDSDLDSNSDSVLGIGTLNSPSGSTSNATEARLWHEFFACACPQINIESETTIAPCHKGAALPMHVGNSSRCYVLSGMQLEKLAFQFSSGSSSNSSSN
ncbi:hypothetical protein ACLKA7_007072 [Drosophila subpalustris]